MGECRLLVKDIVYDEELCAPRSITIDASLFNSLFITLPFRWMQLVSTTNEFVSGEIQLTFLKGETATSRIKVASCSNLKNTPCLPLPLQDGEREKVIQDSIQQAFGF